MILIRTIIVLTAVLCHLASANAQDLESDMPDLENVEVESFGLALKGAIECRRSIGLAGGILDISGSWEFVGQGPVALTGSPILSMTCDAGGDRVAASFGISSAPFYVQRNNSNAMLLATAMGATEDQGRISGQRGTWSMQRVWHSTPGTRHPCDESF